MFDLPLTQRVESIRKYIAQTDLNTLSKNLNSFLDNIFGQDDKNLGWNLLKIQENENHQVFNSVKNFLRPFGPFYELLISLTNNGAVTMPFQSHKNNNLISSTGINSNQGITPIDLFFQYLFNYPLFFSTSCFSFSLSTFKSSVYFELFIEYLQHIFFLKDGTRLIEYLSGTIPLNMINSQFNFRLTDSFIQNFVECLIKSCNEKNFTPNTFQVYLIRTFVKHYYRFLFGNFTHIQIQSTQSNSILSRLMDHKRYLHDSIIFSSEKENHDNSTANSKSIFVMNNLANQFFFNCFEKWPNDLTFSIVLETWLVAVQPWCFVNATISGLLDENESYDVNSLTIKNPHWRDFILSQYPLYLVLLMLFFKRIKTMDLLVEGTTLMLKKMAHFLSNPEMKSMLKMAESELCKDIATKRSFSGIWSPDNIAIAQDVISTICTIKRKIKHEEQTKDSCEESKSWFSWIMTNLILDDKETQSQQQSKLYEALNFAEHKLCDFFNIQMNQDRMDNSRSSNIDWDRSDVWHTSPLIQSRSLSGTPRTPLAKLHMQQKINRRMADSNCNNLSGTFSPQQRSHDRLNFQQNNASSSDLQNTPERRLNKSLNSTFDKQRYDLLSDANKINLSLYDSRSCHAQSDKELLPRSSNEIYFLFKLTICLSKKLNAKFGNNLRQLCNRSDFFGILSRRLFCDRICSLNEMHSKKLEPRIRLRWLANKRNWIWLLSLYLLSSLYFCSFCNFKNFIAFLSLMNLFWILFSCTLAFLIGL